MVPLPKAEWHCTPGRNKSGLFGSVKHSTTTSARPLPFGQSTGQNGADFHSGTTIVPTALQFCMCLSILVIIRGGGHIQLFSLLQSHVKASTASVPQDQNLELNLGNCALALFANLSTVCGPQMPSSHLKTSGFKYQSSTSASLLT